MIPPTLEYGKKQTKYLEEFFMPTTEPHVANYIYMSWKRFIHEFYTKEALAEETKQHMEKINAKYKADADHYKRRKLFINEATILPNISSGRASFNKGD